MHTVFEKATQQIIERSDMVRTFAGVVFAISSGLTPKVLAAANQRSIALIAGITSVSELMSGMEYGLDHFKFFPADTAGVFRY